MKILFLISGSYSALNKKGVDKLLLERDEFGFFEKVYSVHYRSDKNKIIRLNRIHTIIDIDKNIVSTIIALKRLVKKEKIDIIRATNPYMLGYIAYILSMITNVPYCISIHADYHKRYLLCRDPNNSFYRFIRNIRIMIERFIYFKTDMVLPIRESLKRYVLTVNKNLKNIRVIPHGIDTSPFKKNINISEVKKKFKLGDNKIITFAGRINKDNYLYDVIEIAKNIVSQRLDVLVLIIGEGDLKQKLMKKVESKKYKMIKFLGFIPNSDVIDIRMVSDIQLCLMGGFSLIEAAAAGKPLISYDVEWHYELVKNNDTGFLIKEHNIDEAVNSINNLLDNPDLAKQYGSNARKLAFMNHDINMTSKIKIECYKEIYSKSIKK